MKKGNSTVVIVVSCELYAAVQLVRLVSLNVNARLREKARLALFFASPRYFDFFNFQTETSKCFNFQVLRRLDVIKKETN